MAYLRKKTRSDTSPETHLPRGIMRPTDKATADSRPVQSFAVIKTLERGILLLAVFTLELEMDHPSRSETSLCTVVPLPHRHPFSDFFWGKGAAVHRNEKTETDNPSSNCLSKLMDEVRRIVHKKLKPFHFQIKTYYPSDSNYQTDNPSHTNNPS